MNIFHDNININEQEILIFPKFEQYNQCQLIKQNETSNNYNIYINNNDNIDNIDTIYMNQHSIFNEKETNNKNKNSRKRNTKNKSTNIQKRLKTNPTAKYHQFCFCIYTLSIFDVCFVFQILFLFCLFVCLFLYCCFVLPFFTFFTFLVICVTQANSFDSPLKPNTNKKIKCSQNTLQIIIKYKLKKHTESWDRLTKRVTYAGTMKISIK